MARPFYLGVRHAAFLTSDLPAALRFYQECLGFHPYHTGDSDWAMLSLGDTSLSLIQTKKTPDKTAPSSVAVHGLHVGIVLADKVSVDRLHRELTQKRQVSLGRPVEHRDGSYGFYFKDLDGNPLEAIFIPLRSYAEALSQEAWVLVGEGAGEFREKEPFVSFRDKIRLHVPSVRCEVAYLTSDSGNPTLDQAVASLCAAEELQRLRIFPFCLAAAGSLERDIAQTVEAVRKRYPQMQISIEPAVGEHSLVQEAMVAAIVRSAQGVR